MKKSIVLIGFMGVGKTTLGKELARKLQCGFLDIDAEIEAKYGMEAVDIFNVYGEKEFRKTEREMIVDACQLEGKVISVGGGAFMQEEIRKACMEHAIVIFLDMSFGYWKERISLLLPTRPVLQGKSLEEIKSLFDERQAIYNEHHIRLPIDNLDVDAAVQTIHDKLKLL
ncbi:MULTISPECIES: shikimate kinase [Oceanobacillus]|uniref:Shikimate kinase n=1 Tax=Oceanobacillus indicireducens TaxID=1004261 RepID=A0A917Y2U3_9BACI|nr:shikimate kinase [Oceanobacillus indicireducens]GGN64611.1 shikimate kinase [Oceanobacillus indicireducens]